MKLFEARGECETEAELPEVLAAGILAHLFLMP